MNHVVSVRHPKQKRAPRDVSSTFRTVPSTFVRKRRHCMRESQSQVFGISSRKSPSSNGSGRTWLTKRDGDVARRFAESSKSMAPLALGSLVLYFTGFVKFVNP